MLLQLENTNQENINKLLAFAKQNHLQLSLIDDNDTNYALPGNPLSPQQLKELIDKSRKSGIISMQNAHQAIRNNFHAD
jgi:molybdenum cofactor biosynthesis enzyme MoaA